MSLNLNNIWAEKYRPKRLEDIVLNPETRSILENVKKTKDLPHFLFVSSPGTGKSSTAKIIANDILNCDSMYINASDENGIDTIRTKVISFAQTKSLDGNIKVIILDECDGISSEGMRALRNVMEEYSSNTRFILTANYKHKIIEAIHSRCQTLSFDHNIQDMVRHCFGILKRENVTIPDDQKQHFVELVKSHFPDFRKTLNDLQKYSITGTLNITSKSLTDDICRNVLSMLSSDDPFSVRKYVISNENSFQGDYHSLLKGLLNEIYEKDDMDLLKKKECIFNITEHLYRHSFVIDTEINAFACFVKLHGVLGKCE